MKRWRCTEIKQRIHICTYIDAILYTWRSSPHDYFVAKRAAGHCHQPETSERVDVGEQDDINDGPDIITVLTSVAGAGCSNRPTPWEKLRAREQAKCRHRGAVAEMRAPELSLTFTIISVIIQLLMCASGRKQSCT